MSDSDILKSIFCGVEFENPFIVAAAPPSDDLQMARNALRLGWGGIVLKTTHVKEEIVELAYPMMSSYNIYGKKNIGIGNIDLVSIFDIDEVEQRIKILKKEFPEKVVIGSMMGSSKEDWQTLAQRLNKAGADIIECSFSCPQGSMGSNPGAMLAQDCALSKEVTSWIKEAAGNTPVVIKITPMVADIVDTVRHIQQGGADAVCASNTIPALMGINLDTLIPYPNVAGKSTYSGLSGPAIKPVSLRTIAEIKKNLPIEITGTGGVSTWQDTIEFMLVGASNVQLCTAIMLNGFKIINDLKQGTTAYLIKKNISNISEIIGKSLPHICTHSELVKNSNIKADIDQNKCIKCGLCHTSCSDGGHNAIIKDEEPSYKVDSSKCVGCNLCVIVCPKECIAVKEYYSS